jgi:iron only hydrogenase large subunit-like protein/aerobic-type carbon monoxide dehydrogenase small subunit (CoxS/CutS family)
MKIKINNIEYEANSEETVLDVCRREEIPVPTLCSHGKLKREAVCRLCLVEIGGKLVMSCTTKVSDGLEIITESEKIKKAREINLELLWSDHAGKCVACKKNRQCEFQCLAEEYKIENFHFVPRREEITSDEELDLVRDNWTRVVVENENPVIVRTTEYCVECRRCVNICPVAAYGHNFRGGASVIGTPYAEPLDCIFCGACVKHCPTAALTDQGNLDDLAKDLDDMNILAVAIVDPAILESVGNEFSSIDNKEKLAGLLRELGIEKVFDLGWGFQKYAEKLAEEIHPRRKLFQKTKSKKPRLVISSFCPSAELYIKKYFPELAGLIAKTPRPEELMAEAVKNEYARREKIDPGNIKTVLISACTSRKKLKAKALDYIITVREMGRLARLKKINTESAAEGQADKFLDGFDEKFEKMVNFGNLPEIVGEDILTQKANGVSEIKKILEKIKKHELEGDFLEVMVCPAGCGNGGGQSLNH